MSSQIWWSSTAHYAPVITICLSTMLIIDEHYSHDDVIKCKHFPRYWPFVWGIHRSPVNSHQKGQWRGALMFYLICAWTKARLRKQSRLCWFETPLCSLWRHCNGPCGWRSDYNVQFITVTSWWARWRVKSPALPLFTKPFIQCRSKNTSKLRVAGLWAGNSPVTCELPAQMASNAENVSIWWRNHVQSQENVFAHPVIYRKTSKHG